MRPRIDRERLDKGEACEYDIRQSSDKELKMSNLPRVGELRRTPPVPVAGLLPTRGLLFVGVL